MSIGEEEADQLRAFFKEEAQDHLEQLGRVVEAWARRPARPDVVSELMHITHTLKGSAATVGLGEIAEGANRFEDFLAGVRGGRLAASAIDFRALVAAVDVMRHLVDACLDPDGHPELVDALRRELARAEHLEGQEGTASHETGAAATPERRREDVNVLRVTAQQLDRLLDAAGELVFDRTRIERRVSDLRGAVRGLTASRARLKKLVADVKVGGPDHDALLDRLEELEGQLGRGLDRLLSGGADLVAETEALRRTTSAVHTEVVRMRMQPLRFLFQRLGRHVRDVARRTGKQVELVTQGGDTELDKAMVDRISDPLVQLLVNAVVHGIEPAAGRRARGKDTTGRVVVRASHRADNVTIEVGDDGGGVDVERVRAAMVTLGRLSPEAVAALDADEVVAAILTAGVSSRADADADELAGRGVGLAAVREHLVRLGGEVQVASTPGRGTTFVLRVPFTTAMAHAVLFKLAGHVYAVPSLHVTETVQVPVDGGELPATMKVRAEELPVLDLHGLFGAGVPGDARQVAGTVCEFAGRRAVVTCDRVVGPREIVLRSVGALLAPLGLFAGATISGSAKVQLILDPGALVALAHQDVRRRRAPSDTAGFGAPAPTSVRPRDARLLVVDDSPTVRESLARVLEREGYVVDRAADGDEAWRALMTMHYDALVTDLEMPGVDGFELLGRVRARPQPVPVLVITSLTAPETRARAEEAGAFDLLLKPVSAGVLVARVRELLGG